MKVDFKVEGRIDPDDNKERVDTAVTLDGHGEDILEILIAIKEAKLKIK